LDKFLSHYTHRLTVGRDVPIDLAALSAEIGAVVEEREMIPEAVMQPRGGQFYIYLQSNFGNLPGSALRRRFSWAHELGHTLFYESRNGDLKPRSDTPRGDALEAACHRAASMILVPTDSLRGHLQHGGIDTAAEAIDLARLFQVSPEVMLRRLHDVGAFDHGWTTVLTRRNGASLSIEFAGYPVWLKPYLPIPRRGTEFVVWFGATEQNGRSFEKWVGGVAISASPIDVSDSAVIFELRLKDGPVEQARHSAGAAAAGEGC
jgi:hypothetical protein